MWRRWLVFSALANAACSALGGAPGGGLRDIQAPVALEPAPVWPFAFGAAAVIGIAGLVVLRVRRRGADDSPPRPVLRPDEIALAALDRLEAAGADGFGERLSDILRAYAGARYGLEAPEATTGEFLARLFVMCHFEAPAREALTALFESADVFKYAGRPASAEERRRLCAECRSFVTATKLVPSSSAALIFR